VGLLLSFFGFGLLLAFTPCMLPMVPIVSSIVVGQSPRKGLAVWVSLAYVFGMSLAYALAGVAAGLSGTLLAAYLQNPWVLGGLAWVFVVLAGFMQVSCGLLVMRIIYMFRKTTLLLMLLTM
jgi:thiol:disulfide interchange protein DsbD